MEGGLLTIAVLLLIGLLSLVFGIVRALLSVFVFILRVMGIVIAQRAPPGPYEMSRRRALSAVVILASCLYLLHIGSGVWIVAASPPWLPSALFVIAAVSAAMMLAALYGTRNGPRDLFGVVASLVVAGICAELLRWNWTVPPDGPVAEFVNQMLPGVYSVAVGIANQLLPGVYLAALVAALLRALICLQLVGGARRIITRVMRQRAIPIFPASAIGFWAEMRESFTRGRNGHPWRY